MTGLNFRECMTKNPQCTPCTPLIFTMHSRKFILRQMYTYSNWVMLSVVSAWYLESAADWAEEIKYLLTVCYPDSEKIILVMHNLNTHTISSLYKKYSAQEARSYAKRLEIHYTPKYGSWLNIAEIELNVMTRQCLARRLDSFEKVQCELAAWENCRSCPQQINFPLSKIWIIRGVNIPWYN